MRSAEIRDIARRVASLALTQAKQEGRLNVRQGEQLRRALAAAGETLSWAVVSEDPVADASKDVVKMAQSGARSMTDDIVEELANKKTEMKKLEAVARSVQQLAEDEATSYPTELTYSHTAREATQGLVTHAETIIVNNAEEAQSAAQNIEKRMPTWTKLRDEMVVELKLKQKQLDEMQENTSDFVQSLQGLLYEVITTLT